MPPISYSIVIPTIGRADTLEAALSSIVRQILPPASVTVVDASEGSRTIGLCVQWQERLPLRRIPAEARSAARQRNQGAAAIESPLVCFMDDDIVLEPDTMAKLVEVFADESVGGVAGRISTFSHPVPRGLLWCYYRLQAGYSHPNYGGRVIGAAINLLPAFDSETGSLIPSEWLNAGLVVYRRDVFERERFPEFDGYSFLEDAHLSYRVGRTHKLYFRRDAPYFHNHQPSPARADRRAIGRMIVRHQRIFARDLMGLRGAAFVWKFTLHRLFQTLAVLRGRDADRWAAIRGLWEG